MKQLSDTQARILTAAARHPHHLALPPERLPAAARQAVGKALLKNDLVIAVHRPNHDARALWAVDGDSLLLRITHAGLRAIGAEPDPVGDAPTTVGDAAVPGAPPEPQSEAAITPAEASPVAPGSATPRRTLRDAAAAVLAAWAGAANRAADMIPALEGPMAALRAALPGGNKARARRDTTTPRPPRAGTKRESVLAMLRRPEGATVAQIAEATGWAAHTVRGFFAGLKKRGVAVAVLERVRQVGPNKAGAKDSFTIYHVTG
jgi:hypothetical protein